MLLCKLIITTICLLSLIFVTVDSRTIYVFQIPSPSFHYLIWNQSDPATHVDQLHVKFNSSHLTSNASGIWLSSTAPSGVYNFTMATNSLVEETVHVKVTQLSHEAISKSSCRIRLAKVTSSSMLSSQADDTRTPYEKLKLALYQRLKLRKPSRNITIDCLSLYSMYDEVDNDANHTIIRLAVKESPGSSEYLKKEYLTGVLTLDRSNLIEKTGLHVESIGYDECIKGERVNCNDSCTSVLRIGQETSDLITGTADSMTSVTVHSKAECLCLANLISNTATCHAVPDFCRNRGSCVDSIQGPACVHCRKPYTGPNCELPFHKLDGDSYLWLPPLQTCAKSSLTVEFSTNQSDCLILYNGPMTRRDAQNVPDFLSLELVNGLPRFLINTGSGVSELTLAPPVVNDGRRHHIVIEWINGRIFMYRDNCYNLRHLSCSNATDMIGSNRYLNVNTPLQLGRVEAEAHIFNNQTLHPDLSSSFHGTIETLKFNGYYYDMASSSYNQEILIQDVGEARYTLVEEPDPVERERRQLIWIVVSLSLFLVFVIILIVLICKKCRPRQVNETDSETSVQSKDQFDRQTITLSRNASKIFLSDIKDERKDHLPMVKLSASNLHKLESVHSSAASTLTPYGALSQTPAGLRSTSQVRHDSSSIKWPDYPPDSGPVDTVVPYSLEGAYSPGPTLSTIDEIETFSENDNCHLVNRFIDLYLEQSTTASSNDGAEDYV